VAPDDPPLPDRLIGLPRRPTEGGLIVMSAVTRSQRAQGLAALDVIPAGVALHLHRCRSVHTCGMRFALDLVWLDGDGAVARIDQEVRPRRLRTCLRARSVIETLAGEGLRFAAVCG